MPESLGNSNQVLENGVVCDRCNNTVLSDLDQAIIEFFPVSLRRAMLGIQTKAGKFPKARFSGGTLQMTEPGHVLLKVASKKQAQTHPWGFNFNVTGHRMTARRTRLVARAILKTTLECAWVDHGEVVLSRPYDHIREFVLGTATRPGYVLIPKKGDPNDRSLQLTYWQMPRDSGEIDFVVGATYYGVFMGTDTLNARPSQPVAEEVAFVATF